MNLSRVKQSHWCQSVTFGLCTPATSTVNDLHWLEIPAAEQYLLPPSNYSCSCRGTVTTICVSSVSLAAGQQGSMASLWNQQEGVLKGHITEFSLQ